MIFIEEARGLSVGDGGQIRLGPIRESKPIRIRKYFKDPAIK
jgi:hypothetical protein